MCIDFNRVGIASGRISLLYCYCIWLSSQSIFVYLLIAHILRLSLSIRVKFIGTMLIQPLGACTFSSISAVLRQPMGVWVYISRDCINIAIGCVYWGSNWAYKFAFIWTVLMLPLGIKCVYIDFNCIGIATGRRKFTILLLLDYRHWAYLYISWLNMNWDCHWAYKLILFGPC